ncbi:NADP-dependent oxidoreductase [Kitasatospora sp. NPDC001119]
MRAVTITEFGAPDVLTVAELPAPELGEGEVLIRVQAAAVHPLDLVARAGYLGPMLPAGPRYVLGADVAGTVEAIGLGAVGFTPGQAVVGMSNWPDTKTGTQAEYVVLPTAVLAPAPAEVSPVEAATLPLNGLTAAQALDLLALPAGCTLVVTGAAGGVGGFAVELARHRRLRVIGIAAKQDEQFLAGLGAEFIPRSDDPAGAVRAIVSDGVDGVLDCASIGGPMLAAVRDGGAFVAVTPPTPPQSERRIRVGLVLARGTAAQLDELARMVERKQLTLRPPVTFDLARAAEAHQALAAGGTRGGVVLVPGTERG